MTQNKSIHQHGIIILSMMMSILLLHQPSVIAQEDSTATWEEPPVKSKPKPVKNTFESIWLIDNQTVMVPAKNTLEMDIQHRFGTVQKGYEDFWGFFAPSNIRIGFTYSPINRLNVGLGFTKTAVAVVPELGPSSTSGPLWDGSLKYSIITQTRGKYPVSATYYVNAAYNTKKDKDHDIYRYDSDRLTYFHQLLIARKVTEKISVQVAPSLSHQNVVNGYFVQLDDTTALIEPDMRFNHFAVAVSARYKLTPVTSLLVNYDQPLTRHTLHNPNPNFSFGFEFVTSSHAFQLFATNYYYMVPQLNNLYNRNTPVGYTDAEGGKIKGGQFLIGFNITRLWSY